MDSGGWIGPGRYESVGAWVFLGAVGGWIECLDRMILS